MRTFYIERFFSLLQVLVHVFLFSTTNLHHNTELLKFLLRGRTRNHGRVTKNRLIKLPSNELNQPAMTVFNQKKGIRTLNTGHDVLVSLRQKICVIWLMVLILSFVISGYYWWKWKCLDSDERVSASTQSSGKSVKLTLWIYLIVRYIV
jgi:hypothetical protein